MSLIPNTPEPSMAGPTPGRPKTSKINDYLTGRRKGPISAIDEPGATNAGIGRRLADLSGSKKMPGAKQNRFIRETLENNGLLGTPGSAASGGGASEKEWGEGWTKEQYREYTRNSREDYQQRRKEYWDEADPSGRWTQEERDFDDDYMRGNKTREEYDDFDAKRQERLKREYEEATNSARAEREAATAAKDAAQKERLAKMEADYAAETKAARARFEAAFPGESATIKDAAKASSRAEAEFATSGPVKKALITDSMKASLKTEAKEISEHIHGRGGLIVGGLALLGIGAAAMSSQRKGRSRPTPDASIGTGHSSARSGLPVRSSATGIFGY